MQNQKNSAKAGWNSQGASQKLQQEGAGRRLHDAPTTAHTIMCAPVSVSVARQLRRQRVHARRMLRLLRDFYEFGLLRDRGRRNTSLPVGCVLAVRYQSR